ncbi:DNA helicase-2/ATP-dependent DNA helicase PcrA [Fontibacillus solani]|uniref:DNA helicase-2/ATP-dependent DNA helicase PcrA n=1 Tax=Fontibacillus solani TaxID=1572857 RepID=A0A7W3SXQ1_9BACL|nr:RNA polymerase recycling motor HelD [Fontibacillus solani]MBA9087863.1 DNA helicase-2/ATP-dependent DNA helicase PcrA [Fontibacillus solani]
MDKELRQEQERLFHVMDILAEQIGMVEEDAARQRKEVVDFRKYFWEDVTVNQDNFDDLLETIISLRQQAEVLSLSQSSHRQSSKRLASLRRMQENPYFGRIDFAEDGLPKAERIYIGVSSLMDPSGDDFLVYDWRAPVSSVYYDFTPGPAEYTTPGGTIRGELKRKWQYLIRRGQIESMFDTSLTIGDEVLQQVLGQSADKHMRSIVATIQQEQNRIIRHDDGRLLIVQGAAGSGKTSAALQRIAYLLYKYRDRITADQIVLFSPNAMFKTYVSNVLPELGEENMQQVTFQEYLDHRLSGTYEVEDPYGQLEYVLTASDDPEYQTRMAAIRFKASVSFFELIQAYRSSLEKGGMRFQSLRFRGETLVSAEEMEKKFYGEDASFRFSGRIEWLATWLNERINEAEKLERRKPWVQEAIELLSNEQYELAYARIRKKLGLKEDSEEDVEGDHLTAELARMIVRKKLKPLREGISTLQFVNLNDIYRRLYEDSLHIGPWLEGKVPDAWADICQLTVKNLDEGRLSYEDTTPFLLLNELILGFQSNVSIRHVLIDEAQDYSPLQFEFIKRLFPAAKMTVLGDFHQAVFAHAAEAVDFDVLTHLYGADQTEAITLQRSYRSTKPIVEFTRSLIPGGEVIEPFERNGNKPVLTAVTDHEVLHRSISDQVVELKSQGYATIAIICKSATESAVAFKALSGIDELKLVTHSSIEYKQGVVVIPAYLAKGIEFDAVLVNDASTRVYEYESLRRLFYTACTRAMHHLQLYSVGTVSPLLERAISEGHVQVDEICH